MTSAKRHEYGIIFLELDRSNLSLAVFHDASFRNLLDGRSKGCFVVFLVDIHENSHLLIWSFTRFKSVVKSTLGAATISLVEAAENAFLLARFIEEILPNIKLDINCFTDSKGPGFLMNIVRAGYKAPMQCVFFKNSAGNLLSPARFLGRL